MKDIIGLLVGAGAAMLILRFVIFPLFMGAPWPWE